MRDWLDTLTEPFKKIGLLDAWKAFKFYDILYPILS